MYKIHLFSGLVQQNAGKDTDLRVSGVIDPAASTSWILAFARMTAQDDGI